MFIITDKLGKRFLYFCVATLAIIFMGSCKEDPADPWVLFKEINMENCTPVGISNFKQYIVISDSTRDIIYFVDTVDYSIFKTIDVAEPVYINVRRSRLLIPSRSADTVFVFRGEELYPLETFGVLDGSVGVDAESLWEYAQVSQNDHLVHYMIDEKDHLLGGKGSDIGQLMYPSNVCLIDSSVYVVDSGNQRVQVYNKEGEYDFQFGEDMGMEWPTGLAYSDSLVFVSDAILNEVFVFDYKGKYLYSIDSGLDGPSDIEFFESKLYVANLRGPQIKIFKPVK